jgi:hypothetical protein
VALPTRWQAEMIFFLNPSHNAPSSGNRFAYYAIIVVTALVLLVIGVQTLLRTDSEWQQVYVAAGAHWLAGDDFYTIGQLCLSTLHGDGGRAAVRRPGVAIADYLVSIELDWQWKPVCLLRD